MRTAKRVTTLWIVALACIVPAQAGQGNAPQTPKEPSNTRDVECLVRIAADADVVPLNMGTVAAILYSPAVLGKAAKEILGAEVPEDPSRLIALKWMPEAGQQADAESSESSIGQDAEMRRQMEGDLWKRLRRNDDGPTTDDAGQQDGSHRRFTVRGSQRPETTEPARGLRIRGRRRRFRHGRHDERLRRDGRKDDGGGMGGQG